MDETRKIKSIETQLNKIKSEKDILKLEISNKQRELSLKDRLINELTDELNKLKEVKTLRISEHAILRYLERIKNLNIKDIEEDILSSDVKNLVKVLGGSGSYPNKDYKVIIKDYVVTTIIK